MKLAEFNKLRKNCPWYRSDSGICRVAALKLDENSGYTGPIDKDKYIFPCNKKTCAVLYWLNRI